MSDKPTKPGWYSDPYWGGTRALRYFDGKAWTDYTRPDPEFAIYAEGWYPDPDDPTNHRQRWYSHGWTEKRRRLVNDGAGNLAGVEEEPPSTPEPETKPAPEPTNILSALAARMSMPVTVALVLAIILVALLVLWLGGWWQTPETRLPTFAAGVESQAASGTPATATPGSTATGTATPTSTPPPTSAPSPTMAPTPTLASVQVFDGHVSASEENFGSGSTVLDRATFTLNAQNVISIDAMWQAQHQNDDWVSFNNPGGYYCTILKAIGGGTLQPDGSFTIGFTGYTAAIDMACPGDAGEVGSYLGMTDPVEGYGVLNGNTITVNDVPFSTAYSTTTASFSATLTP